MSWEQNRPVYGRLPYESGNWQGNQVVDWVTSYWDNLLVETKAALDSPTDWLGYPDELTLPYIDWVGYGLCGYGKVWDVAWEVDIKRRLIRDWVAIVPRRGSYDSCAKLVDNVCPGATVRNYDVPRADQAVADAAWCGNDIPMIYHIGVPQHVPRNGNVWRSLERIKHLWFPSGARESRVQYAIAMADFAVAGDAVGGHRTFEYRPTN
jgi:hypothetical protein